MKKIVLLLIPFIFLTIAIFIKKYKEENHNIKIEKNLITKKEDKKILDIKDLDSKDFFIKYIIDVIVNGSDRFNLPSGAMEGGYVNKNEARKIAEYLAKLQGFKPIDKKLADEGAALFYGNCTGCHGVEGKGQKGYFPNLIRKPLLGIEMLKKEAR